MAKRDVIIKVITQDKELDSTLVKMEKMGTIDKKNAQQFNKNQKKYQEEQKRTLGILEKARIKETQLTKARERSTNPKAIQRYNKLLDTQRQKIRQMTGETKKQVGQLNQLSSAFSSMGAVIVASFGVQQLIAYGKELKNLSIQMEADNKKNAIVFGQSLDEVTRKAKENANAIGLTSTEYIRASASTQDLLVPLGFARDEASRMSTELTELSGALSVWSGGTKSATEVSEILTKTILGETEQIKTLGIKIDQTSPAFNQRIKDTMRTTDVSLEQAKALEILNQITTKSIDAQTSFASGQKTMAQEQAEANAQLREQNEILATKSVPLWNLLRKIQIGAVEGIARHTSSSTNVFSLYKELIDETLLAWEKWNAELKTTNQQNEKFDQGLKNRRSQLAELGVVFSRSVTEPAHKSAESINDMTAKLTKLRAEFQSIPKDSARFKELRIEIKKLEGSLKALLGTDSKSKKTKADETLLQRLSREAGELKKQLMEQALAGGISAETMARYSASIEVLEKAQRKLNEAIADEKETRNSLMAFIENDQVPKIQEIDEELIVFWDKKEKAYTLITEQEARKREQRYASEQQALQTMALQTVATLQSTYQMYTQSRIAQIDKLVETDRITETEGNARKKQVLTEQAEREKDFKIFSIITSTAQSVANAFADLPWPFNLVIAGLMAGLGGAQLSIVESTPVPAFARGTKGKKDSGMARVGEEGEEFVFLPQGSKVLPHAQTKQYGDIIDAMYDNRLDDHLLKNYVPNLMPQAPSKVQMEDSFINRMIQGFGKEDFNTDAVVDTLKALDKKEDKRLGILVNAIGVVVNKRTNLRR